MPIDVSIITVYYNSPEDILALHRSMLEYLPSGEFEWIVADNHSREDLSDKLPGAVYLRFPENYGFAKANNLAAEKASAHHLFFVNPDCLFVQNCLPALVEALTHASVVGPKVLNEDGTIQLSFGPFLSIGNEYLQKRRMRLEKTDAMQKWIVEKGQISADYVSGCALMISAELYNKIGGFDENFFLYEEDVDLCKRIRNLGLPVAYVPSTDIVHKRNATARTEKARSGREYRKSQIYYYRKHQSWFQNALLNLYLSVKKL